MRAMHDKFEELGLESPFSTSGSRRMIKAEEAEAAKPDPAGTHLVVDVTGHASVTREALLAHATQVDPNFEALGSASHLRSPTTCTPMRSNELARISRPVSKVG